MKLKLFFPVLFFWSLVVSGQQSIGIGTTSPQSSAILDITSTSKGVLIPRMTTLDRIFITSPATGLLVYDITTQSFWYRSSTAWVNLQTSRLLADADGDTKIQVEELPDEDVIHDIEKIKITGFIAQEVAQAAKDARYDFSGVEIPKNPNDLYSLRYSDFVVPLVKAVQELNEYNKVQNAVNEKLQLENQNLQSTNEILIQRLDILEALMNSKSE